jgi:hypothetical protein
MLNHVNNLINNTKAGFDITQRAMLGDVKAGQQVLTTIGDVCINITLGTATLGLLNGLVSSPLCSLSGSTSTENCPLNDIFDLQTLTIATYIGTLGVVAKLAVAYSRLDGHKNPEPRSTMSIKNCPVTHVFSSTTLKQTTAFLATNYISKKLEKF